MKYRREVFLLKVFYYRAFFFPGQGLPPVPEDASPGKACRLDSTSGAIRQRFHQPETVDRADSLIYLYPWSCCEVRERKQIKHHWRKQ
jgi:hypothetical protein